VKVSVPSSSDIDEALKASLLPDVYSAIRAVNWSTLKWLAMSPLYYQHMLAAPPPKKPKPAFVFGGAFHTATLEPEKFDARHAAFTGKQRRGAAWKEWQAAHPGVDALKPAELVRAKRMAELVRDKKRNPVSAELLRYGCREEVLRWTDPMTGLACKGRLDWLRPDLVADLKSTSAKTPRQFERQCVDYGYLGQVAFYHDGATAALRIDGNDRPYIIAVQVFEPHDVFTFQLDDEALAVGRSQYQRLLHRLDECIAADFWPGAARELLQLHVPPWAADQVMALENEEDF
jgi:hypothetical protein